jgi:tetratricopeptide (TPR) repeat protein
MKWLQALERRATQHRDLQALGHVPWSMGYALGLTGDLHGAVRRFQKALESVTQTGNAKHGSACLINMGEAFLFLGDLQKAEECADRGLQTAKAVGNKSHIAWYYILIGRISLCQSGWEKPVVAFQEAVQLFQEVSTHRGEV